MTYRATAPKLSCRRHVPGNSSLSSRSAAFRPAWKNRSRCCRVEPRPALHRGLNQINAPHFACHLKSEIEQKETTKTKNANMLKGRGRAVPSIGHMPQGTQKAMMGWWAHACLFVDDRRPKLKNIGAKTRRRWTSE